MVADGKKKKIWCRTTVVLDIHATLPDLWDEVATTLLSEKQRLDSLVLVLDTRLADSASLDLWRFRLITGHLDCERQKNK
jgi:hypothetical protein